MPRPSKSSSAPSPPDPSDPRPLLRSRSDRYGWRNVSEPKEVGLAKARPSILKRQKERARQERKQKKQERREERKLQKEDDGTTPAQDPDFDPDIAGIVPGPQVLPTDDEFWEQ